MVAVCGSPLLPGVPEHRARRSFRLDGQPRHLSEELFNSVRLPVERLSGGGIGTEVAAPLAVSLEGPDIAVQDPRQLFHQLLLQRRVLSAHEAVGEVERHRTRRVGTGGVAHSRNLVGAERQQRLVLEGELSSVLPVRVDQVLARQPFQCRQAFHVAGGQVGRDVQHLAVEVGAGEAVVGQLVQCDGARVALAHQGHQDAQER